MTHSQDDKGLREVLADELGTAPWSMLEAHARRDGLIFVSPALDLLEVAVAVAEDNGEVVSAWMAAGQLTRPDAATLLACAEDTERQWSFVIVRPFVLVTGEEVSREMA